MGGGSSGGGAVGQWGTCRMLSDGDTSDGDGILL